MRASVEPLAGAVTSYSSSPAWLMVPAKSASPTVLSTGTLSPVIGAWSSVDWPRNTRPSNATRSPGRRRTNAPMATTLASTGNQLPSGCRTVACSGAIAIRPRTALRARSSDAASMRSASANSTITMAASGHCRISMAPVTAMLISALMFRLPLDSAIQPFL